MATEFITPIQPLKFGVGGITASKSSVIEEGTALFKDVFSDAIQNVKDTQKNLEDKQYLVSYEQEATGKVRKYYRITKDGRRYLEEKKSQWQEYSRAVMSVLALEVGS